MEYTKRHAAWHDQPATDTPILGVDLDAFETALDKLLGKDTPAADEVGVWTPGSGGLIYQKVGTNQLAAGAVTDAKVDAAAAIALSKIAGPVLLGVRVLPTSGTYTPTPGTRAIYVEAIGGGGGAGGCTNTGAGVTSTTGGGGGGAYAAKFLTSGFSGASYTVGAGGAGGAGGGVPNAGSAGGDSSFGAGPLVLAKGGSGSGIAGAAAPPVLNGGPGNGGLAASCIGDMTVSGGMGGTGLSLNVIGTYGGRSGGSALGFGGQQDGAVFTNAGFNGLLYGGGGAGAATQQSNVGQTGGSGAAGLIRIWEFA